MAQDGDRPELALPGAAAAFARVAAELEPVNPEVAADVLTRTREQQARALVEALLDGIASGRPWDEVWASAEGPQVADDHLVAALLAASAALMHAGADAAGLEPQQFLHLALHEVPPPAAD